MTTSNPAHRITIEPCAEEVRVLLAGSEIARSSQARWLREGRMDPVLYVPREDIAMDRATRSETRSTCPFKGEATYFSFQVGDKNAIDAAWCYEEPIPEVAAIKDHLAFYPDRVDEVVVGG